MLSLRRKFGSHFVLTCIDFEAETWPKLMDVHINYVRPERGDEDDDWEESFEFEQEDDDDDDY